MLASALDLVSLILGGRPKRRIKIVEAQKVPVRLSARDRALIIITGVAPSQHEDNNGRKSRSNRPKAKR